MLEPVDIISGGFPCQDISSMGPRTGLEGERSGLWREMLRTICFLPHRVALVENVADLLIRGMGRVLGDLAEIGHDSEWDCIPAASVGAPHIRDRVWILAYPRSQHGGAEGWINARSGRDVLLSEGNNGSASERRQDWELVTLVPGIHPRVAEDWWRSQSRMDRSAHGIPDGVDRCTSLGNAVVPGVAQWLAERIRAQLEREESVIRFTEDADKPVGEP